MVVRFNTIIGSRIATHGVQSNNQDGCVLFEFYNNTFTNPGTPSYRPVFVRGGTGFIFDNTSDQNFVVNAVSMDTDRANEDSIASQVGSTAYWEFCDGLTTSSYLTTPGNLGGGYTTYGSPKGIVIDGAGTGGYPCRDQLGRGPNTGTRWNYTGSPPAQPLDPVYLWGSTQNTEMPPALNCETSGDNLCTNQSTNIILANRDYYSYNSSFTGATGVGVGTLASRPSTCTTGVGYWATDQGSWNQSGSGGQGVLYVCTSTNTWTSSYTPYTYPNPLQGAAPNSALQGVTLIGVTIK